MTQDQLIENSETRTLKMPVFRAGFSRDGAATRTAESGKGGLSTMVVTVDDAQSRDFARILRFHLANSTSRPNRAIV